MAIPQGQPVVDLTHGLSAEKTRSREDIEHERPNGLTTTGRPAFALFSRELRQAGN